jgi:Zn-dependent protease with chaperone function
MKKVSGTFFERQVWLSNISGSVKLGPNQAGSVYQKFVRAAQILDIPKLPEVFVSSESIKNATAFGMENYQITLYADLIDFLTEEELLAVIGHELGHVKCQHMLFKSLAYILRYFGSEILSSMLPAGTGHLASIPLQLAILHWERMAEFSCDRAALLVVQDPEIVASALTKLAGGSQKILPELNLDSVLEQARLYEEGSDGLLEKMVKIQMMLFQTHPLPIVRAQKIMEWADSEEYQTILRGDYPRDAPPPVVGFPDPVAAVCGQCQHLNPATAAFCIACGCNLRGQPRICTHCEMEVKPKWRICPGCGSGLDV